MPLGVTGVKLCGNPFRTILHISFFDVENFLGVVDVRPSDVGWTSDGCPTKAGWPSDGDLC